MFLKCSLAGSCCQHSSRVGGFSLLLIVFTLPHSSCLGNITYEQATFHVICYHSCFQLRVN